MSNKLYDQYKAQLSKISDVSHSIAVLHWDKETYIPKKGIQRRAQQIATLSGIAHEMAISKDLGNLLVQLNEGNSLTENEKKNVAQSLKLYQKITKLSKDHVIKLSKTTSKAFHAWHKAKEAEDYSIFAPHMKEVVSLKREEAEMLGYDDHPYDALLDAYEAGEKSANLDKLFADVKAQLVDFVQEIAAKDQVAHDFMDQSFDKDAQWDLGIDLLQQMGYDFDKGRQDIAPHPFTTNFSADDVRVTTRIDEKNIANMIWSCIHEGGHALYEQGLLNENYGLPAGSAISLGIHESQSRLWENNVGRSRAYWQANFSNLQARFPQMAEVDTEAFYKACNLVKPSFIRTESDELTYHFHIMIRYEIEKGLIEGSIDAKDLPEIWAQKYKSYLGIEVPNHKMGVLQDVHWSHGSIGYFPTYSLGSFYAAQFYAQAAKDIPDLEEQIAAGNMLGLLAWLRENIHQYGQLYTAEELCVKISGEPLNFQYFMDYARAKYGDIYGLSA